MSLINALATRGLRHVQIDGLVRVTLGGGWVAWIRPHERGYTATVEMADGRERAATVRAATIPEVADLALTWTADAAEGGPFTVRCVRCEAITRTREHDCVGRRRRSLFNRLRGW